MNNIKFDFYKHKTKFFAVSIAILLIGIVCNFIFGAKLDIQFAGGAVIKYAVTGGAVEASEVQKIVEGESGKSVSVTVNNDMGSDGQHVTLAFAGNDAISLEEQQKVAQVLTEKYDKLSFSVAESNSVDPTMGAKFFQKCLVCMIITVALLLIYITLRFAKIGGLSAGVTAIVALVHDALVSYFVFVIFGMQINDIFIAVVLTILGYSLNDTIIVYDRIRENKKLMGPKAEYSQIMNLSLNQTMARSIYTSLTTFVALLVIYIVAAVYGLTTVTSFALPMMGGVISGCYSSLFVAAPLYAMWQTKKRAKKAGKGKSGATAQ